MHANVSITLAIDGEPELSSTLEGLHKGFLHDYKKRGFNVFHFHQTSLQCKID